MPKILTFFLIPIYTSYLSTYDYGISDLINTSASLLLPIFTLQIQDAVLRYTIDSKYNKDEVFSIALKTNFWGFIFVLIFSSLFYSLNLLNFPNYFYIFLIIFYITNALLNTVSMFCRGIEKIKNIVVGSVLNTSVTLVLNILFLVVFKMGIKGYLIANSLGAIVELLYLFISANLYKYVKFVKDKKIIKEMYKYSFPLIFSTIAWWINSVSDRYILTWMLGVSVSGLYAISYKIPTLLTTFQNIFSKAWSISAIKEFDKNDSDGFVGETYGLLNFLSCVLCSLIMICNVLIAHILYRGEFVNAWQFVPPLLISIIFDAMALFIGGIFAAVKDTKYLSITTIIGAAINTILNFILIKYFGAYGAAIATMIGYFVVLILRNKAVKKHISMKVNLLQNFLVYLLLVVQMILAYFGNKFILIQFLICILIIVIYKNYLLKMYTFLINLIHKINNLNKNKKL